MLKSIETTGKTIELAVQAAIDKLGLDRDSISVEVLENAKSGFLGIGAQPAKIRATYEAPDEEEDLSPKPALSSASRNKKPSSFALKRAAREAEEAAKAEAARKPPSRRPSSPSARRPSPGGSPSPGSGPAARTGSAAPRSPPSPGPKSPPSPRWSSPPSPAPWRRRSTPS